MKKKANLQKKLSINKTIVANLSKDNMQLLAGGAVLTRSDRCATGGGSCETIPYTQWACVLC